MVINIIIHFLRENNKIVVKDKGSYIVSRGPLRGVLIATGPGVVGWSLWNEKAEIAEYIRNKTWFWQHHGMSRSTALIKANRLSKTRVRFNKEEGIHLARIRIVDPETPPEFIKPYFDLMIVRSKRYFK